jgi:hypothetical protein
VAVGEHCDPLYIFNVVRQAARADMRGVGWNANLNWRRITEIVLAREIPRAAVKVRRIGHELSVPRQAKAPATPGAFSMSPWLRTEPSAPTASPIQVVRHAAR